MALIGNRSVLHKSPGRFLSGTVASIERSNFNKPGMLANRFQSMSKIFGGLPKGHLAPSSWSLPRTGGAMSSRNEAVATFSLAGNAAQGINMAGSAAIVFDAAGTAAAVASAVGSASIVFTMSGTAVAPLSAVGSASILFTATGQLSAPASISGSTTLTFTAAAITGAIGHMVAEPIDTALTPDVIAAAVWAYVTRTLTASGGGSLTAQEVWEYATRTLTAGSGSVFATPFEYKASNTTTASDPGPGRFRWNQATQNTSTALYIDDVTNSGLDIQNYFSVLPAGSTIYLQDKDDAGKYQKYLITGITDQAGWTQLTVSLLASQGGNIANNAVMAIVFNSTASDAGMTEAQALQLDELWRLAGLDIANPMTVTPTSRVAGAIDLELTGDPDTSVTVTRQ